MSFPDFKEFQSASLNEATFIEKKTQMILKELAENKRLLILNITESPDYGETNAKSEKAIRDINDGWMNFEDIVINAIQPIKRNLTGV